MRKGTSGMRLSHTLGRISTVFDDPYLGASAGLGPVMGLARGAGLEELARQHLSVPGDKGANAGWAQLGLEPTAAGTGCLRFGAPSDSDAAAAGV